MRRHLARKQHRCHRRLFQIRGIGMPDAAEVHALVLELLHFDDLREPGNALHERILDRPADALRKGHVLRGRERLVAEEDDEVLEPRRADLAHLPVAELAQINAADFGAERAGNALYLEPSHAPFCIRCVCSSPTSRSGGATPALSARCAALPAAWPMAKHAPETRAADWPPCVIEAQRPATSRLSTPSGTSMRYGSWL